MHIVIFSEPGCYKVFMCNRPMHMEPLAPQLCRGGEVLRPGAVRPRMPGQGAGGNVHRGPGEGWRTAGVVAWMCVGGGQFPVSESTCFAQSCTPRQTRSLPSGNVRQRQSSTPQDRGAWSTGTANSKQGMGPIAPSSKHCKLVEDQPHAECIALSLSGQPIRSLKGRWRHATDGDKTGLFELLHVGQALDPQDVCLCATELIAWFFYF